MLIMPLQMSSWYGVAQSVARNDTDVGVHYDGEYAGCVNKVKDSAHYECAVSIEQDGEKILQACGCANSIEDGAKAVGHQFFLRKHSIG